MALHLSPYSDWNTRSYTCDCGWTGTADDAGGLEMYEALADLECPKCERVLVILTYPTVDELRQLAAAGNERARRDLALLEEPEHDEA